MALKKSYKILLLAILKRHFDLKNAIFENAAYIFKLSLP